MKNNTLRKWLSVVALAFVMAVLSLQYQGARAQYNGSYNGPAYFSNGPASSMVERGGYLYVLRGDVMYKIREKDLKVERRLFFANDPSGVATMTPYPTVTSTPLLGEGTPTATPGERTPPAAPIGVAQGNQ